MSPTHKKQRDSTWDKSRRGETKRYNREYYITFTRHLEKRLRYLKNEKLEIEVIIRYGNAFFDNHNYISAAMEYESAGFRAKSVLRDKKLTLKAFKLAIICWISACRVDLAFRILNKIPDIDRRAILKESQKFIEASTEYLVNSNNLKKAKTQLRKSLSYYQHERLLNESENLALKLRELIGRFS